MDSDIAPCVNRVLSFRDKREFDFFICDKIIPFFDIISEMIPEKKTIWVADIAGRMYTNFVDQVILSLNRTIGFDEIVKELSSFPVDDYSTIKWSSIETIALVSKWIWKPLYDSGRDGETSDWHINIIIPFKPVLAEEFRTITEEHTKNIKNKANQKFGLKDEINVLYSLHRRIEALENALLGAKISQEHLQNPPKMEEVD